MQGSGAIGGFPQAPQAETKSKFCASQKYCIAQPCHPHACPCRKDPRRRGMGPSRRRRHAGGIAAQRFICGWALGDAGHDYTLRPQCPQIQPAGLPCMAVAPQAGQRLKRGASASPGAQKARPAPRAARGVASAAIRRLRTLGGYGGCARLPRSNTDLRAFEGSFEPTFEPTFEGRSKGHSEALSMCRKRRDGGPLSALRMRPCSKRRSIAPASSRLLTPSDRPDFEKSCGA